MGIMRDTARAALSTIKKTGAADPSIKIKTQGKSNKATPPKNKKTGSIRRSIHHTSKTRRRQQGYGTQSQVYFCFERGLPCRLPRCTAQVISDIFKSRSSRGGNNTRDTRQLGCKLASPNSISLVSPNRLAVKTPNFFPEPVTIPN